MSLHQVPKNLQEQHQQINHLGETFICQSKNSLHQENNIYLSKEGKFSHAEQCAKSRVLTKVIGNIIGID